MNDYMLYLICYDTPDNKRRRKLVDIIEEMSVRVQWSVFEGWMTPRQLEIMKYRLGRVIDDAEDNIRIYRLCAYCQQEVAVFGLADRTELVQFWVV